MNIVMKREESFLNNISKKMIAIICGGAALLLTIIGWCVSSTAGGYVMTFIMPFADIAAIIYAALQIKNPDGTSDTKAVLGAGLGVLALIISIPAFMCGACACAYWNSDAGKAELLLRNLFK